MSKVKQLKERIKDLEYELDIVRDYAIRFCERHGVRVRDISSFDDENWKRDLAICKRLYVLWEVRENIFILNDEEKTGYFFEMIDDDIGGDGYDYLFDNYEKTLRTNINPFIVDLINFDIYPDTKISKKPAFKELQVLIDSILEDKSEFCKHVQNIFNSVMIDSKILYWDANIFSIIQKYLNLPYHWKEFKFNSYKSELEKLQDNNESDGTESEPEYGID